MVRKNIKLHPFPLPNKLLNCNGHVPLCFTWEYFGQMGSHKFSQNALTVMPMCKIPARGVWKRHYDEALD